MSNVARWFLCLFFSCSAVVGSAQNYPNRPIRIVVPFAAGNSSDFVTRLIATHLIAVFEQQVFIDNRPGAGATIGTEYGAKQSPDGYTLLFGSTGALAINPALQSKLGYNPVTDFAPISSLVWVPQVFVVRADSPLKDVKTLVQAAKEKPGAILFGSGGNGTTQHLIVSQFAAAAQIKLTHVPYKGASAAITDLIGNQISLLSDAVSVVLPHIKSGKVRPIGVSPSTRLPQLPEVPTVDEQGVRFNMKSWMLLVGPAGIPAPIVDRLDSEVRKILARSDVTKTLFDQGFTKMGIARDQISDFIRAEMSDWGKVVTASGAQID